MDTFSRRKRRKIMQAVRSQDSKIEIKFRSELWKRGFRYRKNPHGYMGKPDLINKKKKIVVFIDSCFWHGCSRHCRMPSSKTGYWREKIRRNGIRDKEVNNYYRQNRWRVVRLWEHDLPRIQSGKKNVVM